MSRRTGLILIILAALAAGYVVGNGRSSSPEGRAFAGPTLLDPGAGGGTYIAVNADGDILTLWRLHQGRPVSASRHYFHEAKNTFVEFPMPVPGK